MNRRTLLLAAALLAALLLCASSASASPYYRPGAAGEGKGVHAAFVLGGKRWPGRTITYYDGAPLQKSAVDQAVAAWNASGARIRFVPASRSKAQVQIGYLSAAGVGYATGFGSLGYVPRGLRSTGPDGRPVRGAHVWLLRPSDRKDLDHDQWVETATHELGHVLGLNHEQHRCAVMGPSGRSSYLGGGCPEPARWQRWCRPLEPDDVKGASRLYGGRMKAMGPQLCDRSPAPPAPTELTATLASGGGGYVDVRWHNPASPDVRGAFVVSRRDACPGAPGKNDSAYAATPGQYEEDSETLDPGHYCIAVWSADQYNRPSAQAATVWITVPADSSPPQYGGWDPGAGSDPAASSYPSDGGSPGATSGDPNAGACASDPSCGP